MDTWILKWYTFQTLAIHSQTSFCWETLNYTLNQLCGGYLYLAPLLDSKSESSSSESSGASEKYRASERSGSSLTYVASESSGASIEEQRGEGALFVAGGGEFEGAGASEILVGEGEEFAEKPALQSDSRGCHYKIKIKIEKNWYKFCQNTAFFSHFFFHMYLAENRGEEHQP